jgi:hypothetical protein
VINPEFQSEMATKPGWKHRLEAVASRLPFLGKCQEPVKEEENKNKGKLK